jgi:hypothetical protein
MSYGLSFGTFLPTLFARLLQQLGADGITYRKKMKIIRFRKAKRT